MDKHRLISLDTCRGFAILMVIAFHVSIIYPSYKWVDGLARQGNLGVQLFFIVSAVTMCYMWEQRRSETHRQTKFYIRRAARIAPLFWFSIVFYTLLWGTQPTPRVPQGITATDILLTTVFLHPFSPSAINSVVPGGWSIGIEMGFYAVFPFLAPLRPKHLLPCAFAAYVLLGLVVTTSLESFGGKGESFELFLYYSMLTQFPIFLIGMFVYSVTLRGSEIKWTHSAALIGIWLGTAFAARLLGVTARPFLWIQLLVLATIVWAMLRWSLGLRLMAFVGQLSYSMYLFHFAVLYFIERWLGTNWPFSLGLALTILVTIAVSILSQRTAEKWSQDLGRRLVASLST